MGNICLSREVLQSFREMLHPPTLEISEMQTGIFGQMECSHVLDLRVSNSNCRDPCADYGRHAGFPSGKRSEV